MARPCKYDTHVKEKLTLVEAWARDGLTLDQIAHNLGIAKSTLCDYQNNYSDLSNALKRGKEVVDIEVENSLLKRAMGYTYVEETQERDRETGDMVVTKRVVKEVQPDTTAQIFWLKNRKPVEWRDKQHIEQTGTMTMNHTHDLSKMSDKELEQLETILNKHTNT